MSRPRKQKVSPPPAKSIEDREAQLVALANDVAEQQLREGTASAQVITHYLRLGTTEKLLEKEKLRKENLLLEARTKAIESAASMEKLYLDAMNAMRTYSGSLANESRDIDDEDVED